MISLAARESHSVRHADSIRVATMAAVLPWPLSRSIGITVRRVLREIVEPSVWSDVRVRTNERRCNQFTSDLYDTG